MIYRLKSVPDISSSPSASIIIAQYLKEAIVSGMLVDHQPIRQDKIAALFNVSKIPVREALKTLEAEGFVKFNRNRGAIVAGITEHELLQFFEIRAVLESTITRIAVPKMDSENFAQLMNACEAFRQEEDPTRWAELNWALHASIYIAAERPHMLKLIRSVYDKVERYMRVQLAVPDGMAQADREHREIYSACKDGDADEAARLIHDHVVGVCTDLQRKLTAGKAFSASADSEF
ncbi:GntR family transcriptional regulator (plasmid) [Pantoea cypripedii]|uniref:GntR family transcriptional regulator n=2 Tax=Pantoea cypripedii TaxID=55209 RepID=A0A6B9G9R5_PANCY|nr:GntR family transcriptional regulator [Pantoea cypripedii]